MRSFILEWAAGGKPLYAECGGLMYLSQGIHCDRGFVPMVGVFPFETEMKSRRSRLGYREITLKQDSLLGQTASRLRGHEFHYSEIRAADKLDRALAYEVKDGSGRPMVGEGYRFKNTLASYIHVHFGSNRGAAGHFAHFREDKG